MIPPNDLDDIVRRFIDDCDALEEHEYARLVDAVKASPELGRQLRDQLMIDDALSQRLAIDRRQFDAQVQQRVADYLRGEEELNLQADELRSLALSHLKYAPTGPRASGASLLPLAIALSLLLVVGVGIWAWQKNQSEALLARVESVEGRVVVRRLDDHDQFAQDQLPLRQGDRLLVEEDAALTLRWADGTLVRLEGGSVADLPTTASGKRVYIDEGKLSAVVAKQPAGRPMVFATPHADAIVRGTKLSLHVRRDETELEVAEGRVELVERRTNDAEMVAAGESAVAAAGEQVAKRSIQWPTSRDGLIYLFAGGQRPVLVRSGGLMRPARLEPEGAKFNAQGEMELSGGLFVDAESAKEIAQQLQAADGFTLEAVLDFEEMGYNEPRSILALEGPEGVWLGLQHESNLLKLVIGSSDRSGKARPSTVLTYDASPHIRSHLVVTVANGELRSYSGGVETNSPTGRNIKLAAREVNRLIFGGSPDDANLRWQGRIAGVAIYDRALSAEEIARNVGGFNRAENK